jgi:hypothetical protein
MQLITGRRGLLAMLGVEAVLAVVLVVQWKSAIDRGRQRPVEPFRIAGEP